MKHIRFPLILATTLLLLAGLRHPASAQVAIQSFDETGALTFSKITNALYYRVEAAPVPEGTWTNLWSAANPGSGTATALLALAESSAMLRVIAITTSSSTGTPPPDMVLIPASSFVMGAATNVLPSEFDSDAPQHDVYISAFYIDPHEVTKARWDDVVANTSGNGYTYTSAAGGKAANHPVHTVSWYDAVKWCNARSEMDGLTPVYYTDEAFTIVYKTNNLAPYANWSASGYRLPTEAEWEKAARGGVADHRFPWSDTDNISHTYANYGGGNGEPYDLSTETHNPDYDDPPQPYTSPAGSFSANGYGLYDMAGNVWEWCWDWYDGTYYETSPGVDPRGPEESLTERVQRGGSWDSGAYDVRVSFRGYISPDDTPSNLIGFRCVRNQP